MGCQTVKLGRGSTDWGQIDRAATPAGDAPYKYCIPPGPAGRVRSGPSIGASVLP